MYKSIRFRLMLWYAAVLAAVLIAFSIGFYSLLEQSLRQRLDGGLRSATEVTALALNHETEEHHGKIEGEENLRLLLNTMYRTSFPRASIAVWEGDRLVAEKPGDAGVSAAQLPAASRVGASFQSIQSGGAPYRVAAASIRVASSGASYRITANESLQPIETEMRNVREVLLITVPVCLLLAAGGGYFLARKSLEPVLGMARTAEQISSHNLDQRLEPGNTDDELGLLADTINRLFERLQRAFRQQRQFMADASHELRTPLSVALTATQVSLKNRNEHDVAALYDTLEVVQSQMLRLGRVVEGMFTLAQADSGAIELHRTSFYMEEILAESIRAGRVLGDARGVEIRTRAVAAEAEFVGDEGLLRQLLLILLDNAIKYTPQGGHVDVSLEATPNAYRIEVADTGCGVPPADQPHIFDRFYRADKSRSRRQPGAGSGAGLGLAIAQWITQLHHGAIQLEKSDAQGATFSVVLPRA